MESFLQSTPTNTTVLLQYISRTEQEQQKPKTLLAQQVSEKDVGSLYAMSEIIIFLVALRIRKLFQMAQLIGRQF